MHCPPSPHFSALDLSASWNRARADLPRALHTPDEYVQAGDTQSLRGIPFAFGEPTADTNVIMLDDQPVAIDVAAVRATYVLFLHAVEDRASNYQPGFADYAVDGNELGDHVATYRLEYADGDTVDTPILRRFAIQQSRIGWGASAFAAVTAEAPEVTIPVNDAIAVHGAATEPYGRGETRVHAGRDHAREHLWIYALPNPHPDKPIHRIVLSPGAEQAAIYAVTVTQLQEHPLRPGVRRKARLTLPAGAQLNAIGEYDDLAIDLGTVISARAALAYDAARWLGADPNVQPEPDANAVLVEYSAHPAARLYVGLPDGSHVAYDLASPGGATPGGELVAVNPADRLVHVRVVDKATGRPVPVRLHLHGAHGEYLPPRGHHRKVNRFWFEDNYPEHVTTHNQYAYIDGACEVDLPLGPVFVEITRGYEVAPVRTQVEITPATDELVFALEHVLDWRSRGWVTADTHVHFLSPQTALLEGQAEGVHVVNLLASQWGEMYSNVGDFDGRTTVGARDFGGDGEFLVRVGTENRMQVLGHISLLGYGGAMIHPLCTGGPTESALGDPQEVTMAEWAQRCIDQGGLTVMPHAPNPQLERAADIVLGVVNAIEMMTFNPMTPDSNQINAYGVADWYRYLNLGYQIPVVGGSDKMQAWGLLGGIRTYAHLGGRDFTYGDWMDAMRAGNTFVTVGPLAELTVEGVVPGGKLELPAGGGTVGVDWRVESVSLPIEAVEVVVGGLAMDRVEVGGKLSAAGSVNVPVTASTWVALRVRGSYQSKPDQIAAHTSAVMVTVGDQPVFAPADALTILEQIEGALAYVDTIAPRPDAVRFKQLRATLEAAHNRLHQRMHRAGIYHEHTVLHDHAAGREH